MTPIVQVGTVLIGEGSPRMIEVLALQSEPYFGNWNVVKCSMASLSITRFMLHGGTSFSWQMKSRQRFSG